MAILIGGTGDDSLVGGNDDDTLIGDAGNDTLIGGGGGDLIEGGSGYNQLYAAGMLGSFSFPYYGNSFAVPMLDRGSDVDTLRGGNDVDLISAGFGDQIDGGGGSDTLFISFQGASNGVSVDFRLASQSIGGGVIKNIESVAWAEGSAFDDVIIDGTGSPYGSFGVLFGMAGNDSLVAGYYTGALFGGDGGDTLDGRGSQYLSTLDGGTGDDLIFTPLNGFARSFGGDGDDVINGTGAISGGDGNDRILLVYTYYSAEVHGDAGNDEIVVADLTTGSTILFGDAGDDTLRGGGGNDLFNGGAGDDRIIGGSEAGPDLYYGGAAGDTAIYSGRSTDYVLDRDAATGIITITDSRADSPDGADRIDGIEFLRFSDGTYQTAQVLAGIGLGGGNLVGGDGDDIYVGNEDANSAIGNGGNDTLSGNGGNDTLVGGAGADQLDGGTGDDRLLSNGVLGAYVTPYPGFTPVAPDLDRDAVADTLRGGAGNDTISAGFGDQIDGGVGIDTLFISFQGASAGITVDFRLASQQVGATSIANIEAIGWAEGSGFDDVIIDGPGNGYAGFSTLFGMAGNDRLVAGYYT
ncbi:hypothetical protein IP88_06410 [alpha proteobacterium AAP81b]|nr:hypothetical protein IP88_06410 [alpha proteobacterium AAP81b]